LAMKKIIQLKYVPVCVGLILSFLILVPSDANGR
jgi:hypothetical protein